MRRWRYTPSVCNFSKTPFWGLNRVAILRIPTNQNGSIKNMPEVSSGDVAQRAVERPCRDRRKLHPTRIRERGAKQALRGVSEQLRERWISILSSSPGGGLSRSRPFPEDIGRSSRAYQAVPGRSVESRRELADLIVAHVTVRPLRDAAGHSRRSDPGRRDGNGVSGRVCRT
jgi:hypothetical protein